MIEKVADTSLETLALYDAVIDVRSPAEFNEDHLPDAINLPVLSNEERAEVGTIYTRESRFRARRIGAAYVARNVAAHLQTALADREAKFRPLLYCWRGGMRSNAMATILSQIGWRVGVLEGGYRAWRRAVVAGLTNDAPLHVVLIDGQTGSAKTDILKRMASIGIQTIDLEALAEHRGSVFGGDPGAAQPSQKFFETSLYDRLRRLDPARPIAVEAESNAIGRIGIPKRLWTAMRAAPRIVIETGAGARARYLVRAYAHFIAEPGAIAASIGRLKSWHSKETIAEWLALAEGGRHEALAERLMLLHYDPMYDRSRARDDRARDDRAPVARIALDRLETEDLNRAAEDAAAIVSRLTRR